MITSAFESQQNAVYATVAVSYLDSLIVTGAPDGTEGFFSASFYMPHTFSTEVTASGDGAAARSLQTFVASFGLGEAHEDFSLSFEHVSNASPFVDSTFPDSSLVTLTTPFVFGQAFDLSMKFQGEAAAFAQSQAGSPGLAKFSVDFWDGIYWAGGSKATDADGRPLRFEFTSTSGTDYNRSYVPGHISAVPESGAFAAVGGAMLLLASLGRSRRAASLRLQDRLK